MKHNDHFFPVDLWSNKENKTLSQGDYVKIEGFLKHNVWKNQKQEWKHRTVIVVKNIMNNVERKTHNFIDLNGIIVKNSKRIQNSKFREKNMVAVVVNTNINKKSSYKNHLNVNFWNDLVSVGSKLKVGDQVKIVGKLNTSSWKENVYDKWNQQVNIVAESLFLKEELKVDLQVKSR